MIKVIKKDITKTPFAEGGEGLILEYKDGNLLKIFKPGVAIDSKLKKVKYLIKMPNHPALIKPLDLVELDGKFVGYVMERRSGEELRQLANKKFVKANKITMQDTLKVLIGVRSALDHLYANNIVVGDLNDLNIIFDDKFNVYFLDCDSWAIDGEPCEVAMDSFKDPLLKGSGFTKKTDSYAYAVMAFKALTKIHPFGGITNPELELADRMKQNYSVLGTRAVTVPKTIPAWNFIPPKVLASFLQVFEKDNRELLDLSDWGKNLKQCSVDGNFYYSKFSTCPYCDIDAKVKTKPDRLASEKTGNLRQLFDYLVGVDMFLDDASFINTMGLVEHIKTGRKAPNSTGRIYFSENANKAYRVLDQEIQIFNWGSSQFELKYSLPKLHKSSVIVQDNKIYYIGTDLKLKETLVESRGTFTENKADSSFNSIFSVDGESFFLCSIYTGMFIIDVDGYQYRLQTQDKILNYGIHHDKALNRWLFVYENAKNKFSTYVFDKNTIKFESKDVIFTTTLSNLIIDAGRIFIPYDGFIRAYAPADNKFKDFDCHVVTNDSQLIKRGKSILIVNEKDVYAFG